MWDTNTISFASSFSSNCFPKNASTTRPSKPSLCQVCILSTRYSEIVGTPASCMRNNVMPVPASSFSA